ncbi:MAG TPA: hypothetical protein VGH89_12085 [Pseudonocardia sp.]
MQVSESAAPVLDAATEYPFDGANPGGGWCENYALVANDPDTGINLCLYQGRQPFDLTVWHEILLLSLPDGRVLVWKSAGRGGYTDGGGGAMTAFRCLEPGRRWQVTLDGLAWHTTAAALAAGPFHDGPWTRVALDLSFEAAMPPWILGNGDLEHAQEHLHYEQLGRVTGAVTVDGRRLEFAGTGHRDHSRGPRDFRAIRDHAWVNCLFPSGRAFALYRMRLADGSGSVAVACVYDGTTLRPATVNSMPLLAETDDHDRYQLRLDVDGSPAVIHAEIQRPVGTVSYVTPNHMTIGASHSPQACMVVQERGSRFTWDGEVGFGHTQRSSQVQH